jgi:hypothetical protein
VYELTEEERGGDRLPRFEGGTVPGGPIWGLRQRFWNDGDLPDGLARDVAEGVQAVIRISPGFAYGAVNAGEEQDIRQVVLTSGRWGDLDPVTASEVIADLTLLTGFRRE